MFILWVLIGIVIYYFVIKKDRIQTKQPKENEAVEVLKLRYVNGELDDQEYEKIKKMIED
jgi:uncharacterized membrane protein